MLLKSFSKDIDSLSVFVIDPISKQRIKYPVRGKKCDHLQCFDLQTYLNANLKSKRWQCPYCGKSTLTLRSCSLTAVILEKCNELYPNEKYKLATTQEDLVNLLIRELQNYEMRLPELDDQNDIWKVWFEREDLCVMIEQHRNLIDRDRMILVEDKCSAGDFKTYLPQLKLQAKEALNNYEPQCQVTNLDMVFKNKDIEFVQENKDTVTVDLDNPENF